MRPAPRLLALVLAIIAVSVLALSQPALPLEGVAVLWGALALVLVVDLVVTPSARGVEVALEGPGEVFTGQTAHFSAQVSGWNGPAQGLEGQVSLTGETPEERATMRFAPSPTGIVARLEVRGRRRGVVTIEDLWLKWPSQLGLWELVPRVRVNQALHVMPNIQPVSSGKIDVQVRSDLYGIKDNQIRGEGAEFHQLRDFTTGMDTRAIDWKRSARRRDLVAKEMRAERNHQVMLVLDNGYLMREDVAGLPKIDHAINAALGVTWAAGLGADLVGLYTYAATPGLYVPPSPGRNAFARLRRQLADLSYESVESNPTLALATLNGQLKRRSLVIVFSDFVDSTTAELLVENMAVLSRHHVLIFVALRAPRTPGEADSASTSFEEMSQAVARAQLRQERQLVLDRLRRLGILCLDVEPGGLTPGLVSLYLQVKSRGMI
ncbi:MAG: DUF58 domain-containing protein [Pseudomonadota bacterium]